MKKILFITSILFIFSNSYGQLCLAEDITSLWPIENITWDYELHAENTISLPNAGQTLLISSSSNVFFYAGNSIRLKSGFRAVSAENSSFKVQLADCIGCDEIGDIELEVIVNGMMIGPEGDNFGFLARNATRYSLEVVNRNGDLVCDVSGFAAHDEWTLDVWDGTGCSQAVYVYRLILENSCGDVYEHYGDVTLLDPSWFTKSESANSKMKSIAQKDNILGDIDKNSKKYFDNRSFNDISLDLRILSGKLILGNLTNSSTIELTDITGKVIYSTTNQEDNIVIDLSDHPEGIYILNVISKEQIISEKIHLQH